MNCPICGAKTRIVETRQDTAYNETYRKHKCSGCEHAFYTREFAVPYNDMFKQFWSSNDRVKKHRAKKKGDAE